MAIIKLDMFEKYSEMYFRNPDILFMNFSAAISMSSNMLDMVLQKVSPPCFMFCILY